MKRSSIRALVMLSAIAVGAGAVTACTAVADDDGDAPRTLRIGVDTLVPAASSGWDPAQSVVNFDGAFSTQAVFDPLVGYAPDGSPIPVLATGYDVSEDRLTIDIRLREDVEFVDGTRMDAAGIEKYYDYLLSEDSVYPFKANAAASGIEFAATGEYDLQLTATSPLYHPDGFVYDIVRLLFVTPILSPAAIDDPEAVNAAPVGSGPYLIEEHSVDSEMTLVRNPDYWDPERFPYDTIVLKQLQDPVAKLNALKSGQIDVAPIPAEQVAEAEASGLTVFQGSPNYRALLVHDPANSTAEPLRDTRVRQAIALSFDREGIAANLDLGFGCASSQAFVEGQAEYVEGGDDRYGYDVEAARELLAEAGYPDGFDLVIPVTPADAGIQPIIQQSLGDIGIRVTFDVLPDGGAYVVATFGGQYPLFPFTVDNFNTLRLLDEEFTGLGRVFAFDEEMSALIQTVKFGDPDESAEASQLVGEKVLDEAWYIPYSRPGVFWGSDGDVVEVAVSDTLSPFLWDFRLPE